MCGIPRIVLMSATGSIREAILLGCHSREGNESNVPAFSVREHALKASAKNLPVELAAAFGSCFFL